MTNPPARADPAVYVPENMVGVAAFRPAVSSAAPGCLALPPGFAMTPSLELSRTSETMQEVQDAAKPRDGGARARGHRVGDLRYRFRPHPSEERRQPKHAQPPVWRVRQSGRSGRSTGSSYLRAWGLEFTEVHEPGRVTRRSRDRSRRRSARIRARHLPDDRTIVFDESRDPEAGPQVSPGVPAYLSGPEWDRASRGLLAVAINNRGGAFAKAYDLGRPDDAVVLPLFKGVDRWVFGVDDADAIAVHALAVCGPEVSETIARRSNRW